MKMKEYANRTCVPWGGVIPVFSSKNWRAIICFANVKNNLNKKRDLFSLAGKICKKTAV
jgi:hypothetical protein